MERYERNPRINVLLTSVQCLQVTGQWYALFKYCITEGAHLVTAYFNESYPVIRGLVLAVSLLHWLSKIWAGHIAFGSEGAVSIGLHIFFFKKTLAFHSL